MARPVDLMPACLGIDLPSLIGLGLTIVLSFWADGRRRRRASGGFSGRILGYLRLGSAGWAAWLLELFALMLGLLSSWLVFLWVSPVCPVSQ